MTWEGEFRTALQDQAVYPRPQQDPLPVWIAVGGTPQSIVRAGRLGLPVALAIIGGDPARFRVLADLYRKTLVEWGHNRRRSLWRSTVWATSLRQTKKRPMTSTSCSLLP